MFHQKIFVKVLNKYKHRTERAPCIQILILCTKSDLIRLLRIGAAGRYCTSDDDELNPDELIAVLIDLSIFVVCLLTL